jgi:hypothetical protein
MEKKDGLKSQLLVRAKKFIKKPNNYLEGVVLYKQMKRAFTCSGRPEFVVQAEIPEYKEVKDILLEQSRKKIETWQAKGDAKEGLDLLFLISSRPHKALVIERSKNPITQKQRVEHEIRRQLNRLEAGII